MLIPIIYTKKISLMEGFTYFFNTFKALFKRVLILINMFYNQKPYPLELGGG